MNEYTSDEYADDGISAHNKSYLKTHLKLLRLAKYAKDKYVRDFAIQTIAKSQLNGQFINISLIVNYVINQLTII